MAIHQIQRQKRERLKVDFKLVGLENGKAGTSLAVQSLRLRASTAEGAGLIPGQGTKIPHAVWCSQKKKKIQKKNTKWKGR